VKTLPPPTDPWGEAPGPGAPSLSKAAEALANDLNNVLTVITGNLAQAERHAAGNEKLIRLLDKMRLAAERGGALARTLASLSPNAGPPMLGAAEETPLHSRILVVEDDVQLGELAAEVLTDLGHVVDIRPDAPSAMALLRDGPPFNLVFSDIVMPGGMNGIELAEHIARTYPKLPVLLATGYSTEALTPGALRFPMLPKPYGMKELARRVSQMLPVGV